METFAVNGLCYELDGEQYILLYGDGKEQAHAALRTAARWACNPDLNFCWIDAAKLAAKIRNACDEN